MPARRHLRLLAALLAFGLLGAACGDDDSGEDDPTVQDGGATDDAATDDGAADDGGDEDGGDDRGDAPDPCSLITPAELEEIVGSPYEPGELADQADTGTAQCTWTNTDAPPVKIISVVIDTTDSLQGGILGQAVDSAEAYYELQKQSLTVDEELEIGDEAFRGGSAVYILDGDTVYGVSAIGGVSDEAIAALVAIAERVVD